MRVHRTCRRAVAVALGLLLSACGGGLDGTFEDEHGMSVLSFHPDGRVVMSSPLAGVEQELAYEVDGDRIRVRLSEDAAAALVLTRVDADTLSGPVGMRYRRSD